MFAIVISRDADEIEFRNCARRGIAQNLSPEQMTFVAPDEPTLLPPLPDEQVDAPGLVVPRSYSELLHDAICHRAGDRFALLYDVLWRVVHGQRDLPLRAADPVVARLNDYAHNVRRDIHKMHAFLRFRACTDDDATLYTAWFEPKHFILRRAVPFFIDRFSSMDWLIATPIGTALWKDGALIYGPPVAKPIATEDSILDDVWLTYYRTTFNPARLRVRAMTKEMPKHYWHNMPETALIRQLVAGAGERISEMDGKAVGPPPLFADRIAARASPSIGVGRTPIAQLRAQASSCTRCPLYGPATQTVFGEGPEDAQLVFVGEQPGDQEDIAGRPFVGAAGNVFDRALTEAGISRESVYVTNAVKHFKYEPRGKRRIHSKPNSSDIQHCRWWIEQELAVIAPRVVVALGGTAAQSLTGRTVAVLRERGPTAFGAQPGFITVHPSYLLRLPDAASRTREYNKFVADLVQIRQLLAA